jgi:hypothetical protein
MREGVLLSGEQILLKEKRLPDIKVPKNLDAKVTAALKKGKFHGFRSGGGLRVFRIDKGNKCVAYGEHPNAMEALALLARDSTVGGRVYGKVYGVLHPHYLTGSSAPEGELDHWILQGNTIDANVSEGVVTVVLEGYGEFRTPTNIYEQARKRPGVPIVHTNRGFTFETTSSSTRCVGTPEGKAEHRAWMWQEARTGMGASFFEAFDKALAANPVETERG